MNPSIHTTRPPRAVWDVVSVSLPDRIVGCAAVTGLTLADAVILVPWMCTADRV